MHHNIMAITCRLGFTLIIFALNEKSEKSSLLQANDVGSLVPLQIIIFCVSYERLAQQH